MPLVLRKGDDAQPARAAGSPVAQARPAVGENTGRRRGRRQRIFLFVPHHGFVAQAQDEAAAFLLQPREPFVIFGEVAITHIGGTGLELLAPHFALAHRAGRDRDPDGPVFPQVKGHVQTHRVVGLPGLAAAVARPGHARERRENGAVARQPKLPGRARVFGQRSRALPGEAGDQLFQQARIEHLLRFGKSAATDRPRADFGLHAFQLAGRAEGAHLFEDRVDQRAEKQAEIIELLEFAFGIFPGGVPGTSAGQSGEALAEIAEQFPLPQSLLGEGRRAVGHALSATKGTKKYQ